MGHGAFSHSLEYILQSINIFSFSHEAMSLNLLDRIVSTFPDNSDFTFCRKEFEFLFEAKTGNANYDTLMDKNGLYSIVSDHYNGIDCDRLDYLRRDIMNSGYSQNFDNVELVSKFQFLGEFNGRGNHIAFAKDDVKFLNNFLGLRHQMFKNMYLHEKSEEYDLFFRDLVCLFEKELDFCEKIKSVDGFIELTDK